MFGVAILLGMVVTERNSSQPALARLTYIVGVVGGVIVGRLWYSVQYGFSSGLQGFSFYGFGFGGAAAFFILHSWLRGLRASSDFPDAAAPAMALAAAIHRVGCFYTGCCFGKVCELPWAVQYGTESPAFWKQVSSAAIPESAQTSLPVHPTQLYGTLFGLIAFVTLLWLRRSKLQLMRYELSLGLGLAYSVYRFFMETLRDDAGGWHLGWLTFSQVTSIGVFLLTLYLLLSRRLRFGRGDRSLLRLS